MTSKEPCVWKIPSCPESHVATDGISLVLVHEQKTTDPISSGPAPGALERRPGRLQRDVLEAAIRVAALLDPGLLLDLVRGHRRPAVGRVADQVLVRADDLALDDRQRLEARHEAELLAHDDGRERLDRPGRLRGRHRPRTRRTLRPHAPDELEDLVASRHERHHEVVVADPAHLLQPRLGQIPRILVVEDHREAVQRLELGHRLRAVEDLLVAVGRAVGVVRREAEGEVRRVARDLGHGRLHRRELGRVMALVAEDVEQDREDPVLGRGVPRGRERGPRLADGGDLPLPVFPGGQQRQEDVVAVAREIAPPGRPLLVHGHRVPVAPDQVHRDVPQQRRARAVAVRIDALQDLGAGRRLGLEVAPDHGRELIQRLEDREVQVRAEVGGKDETAVPVDDERPHPSPALPSCPTVTYVDVRSLLGTLIEWRAVAHPCSREPRANLETAPSPAQCSDDFRAARRSNRMATGGDRRSTTAVDHDVTNGQMR